MMRSANRWVVTVGWITVMAFVWAIFVPGQLSNLAFALIAAAGLFVTICGLALLSDSEAPRSVSAILADLEAGGGARSKRPNRGATHVGR